MRGVGFALKHFSNMRILLGDYVPERVQQKEWNKLFESGAYERLRSAPERPRYSLILGHCELVKAQNILDVGCGQGVLAARLRDSNYTRYLGVDISAVAIDQARSAAPDPRHSYVVADATTFHPDGVFDLIVFNECLNYMSDPAGVIRHYMKFLDFRGHVSISLYNTVRSRAIWRTLNMLNSIESVYIKVENFRATWTVKLMRPV
jgi:2-polyprenyl-6-hydroxyphenyl methylase/3-demethylubiquinone-9 3-methyltransferase